MMNDDGLCSVQRSSVYSAPFPPGLMSPLGGTMLFCLAYMLKT